MEKNVKRHKKQTNNDNKKNNVNIEQLKLENPDKTVFDLAGTTFIIDKKYSVVKKLGHGAYGVVCSCKDNEKNVLVAMKKIQNAF